MGLSETIMAAMIGALATMTTALFQLFSAWKVRGKVDVRPKRGSTLRSILSVIALMIASAGGGFLYSEFLKQRNGEDLRAMRQEVREMKDELKSITSAAMAVRNGGDTRVATNPDMATVDTTYVGGPAELQDPGSAAQAESVVYVPACRRNAPGSSDAGASVCEMADAQRIALCGTIPAYAKVRSIDLFAQPDAVQQAWDLHRVSLEQDLGGARFTGKTFEYAQGQDLKAVCVNFLHWSSDHPHIARIVVRYGFGETPTLEVRDSPSDEPTTERSPKVIAAEHGPALPQAASLSTPVIAQ
jgi:hypothetical protein